MDRLFQLLKSKNQQGMRQLKFIINRGVEYNLYTTQGFKVLSVGLTGAVNGTWDIEDVDKEKSVIGFNDKDGLWQTRRRLAKDFWVK